MKAAVLTIGNEVSSGQIVNTNAAWISQELEDHKIEVCRHLTVQDEDSQIYDALNFVSSDMDIVIVTGGLGPTKDDITRNSVTRWLDDELRFDETSWQKITDRLNQYGMPIAESNRQQCYFPQKATILQNNAGTANAFYCKKSSTHLWCLPGPPQEIKQIWSDHVAPYLKKHFGENITGLKLMLWQCLGKSESALGEIVEEAIAGSSLSTGYRPHIPYVEVKLWSQEEDLESNQKYLDKMEQAIKPWLVCKGSDDLAQILLRELGTFSNIKIFDFASAGLLADRLGNFHRRSASGSKTSFTILSQWDAEGVHQETVLKTLELAEPEEFTLAIGPIENNQWNIGLAYDGFIKVEQLTMPYKNLGRSERLYKFQLELSIHHWCSLLASLKSQVVH